MLKNRFKYSNTNKRYHSFDYYLKEKYHSKVFKVGLNAGFTCPNRDGSISVGGCFFCSKQGSGEFAGNIKNSLLEQFDEVKERMHTKWPNAKYIVYFQSYSNTYDSLEELKKRYELFIGIDNVVGIAIATRPDCLNKDIIAYLNELNNRIDVYLELGLQTINDKTASLFNRGYDFNLFDKIMIELRQTNIKVCIHLINGLPNETKDDMLNNIKVLNKYQIHAIKIHMLNIIKGSKWANDYSSSPFNLLSKEEYVKIVVEQLRYLREDIVVQRLTGDAKKEDLIAPTWTLNKTQILNDIDKLMRANNYYQGELYE